jgi:hypothetical protein
MELRCQGAGLVDRGYQLLGRLSVAPAEPYDMQVNLTLAWNRPVKLSLACGPPLREDVMGLGKGALLWLIGIPLPIIILLAIFWR